jgi:hypothetical protein
MELGRLGELIEKMAEDGTGVTVMPIRKGMRAGGFGSDEVYASDGWEVGYLNPNGGGDLARAATLPDAVEQAFFEIGT